MTLSWLPFRCNWQLSNDRPGDRELPAWRTAREGANVGEDPHRKKRVLLFMLIFPGFRPVKRPPRLAADRSGRRFGDTRTIRSRFAPLRETAAASVPPSPTLGRRPLRSSRSAGSADGCARNVGLRLSRVSRRGTERAVPDLGCSTPRQGRCVWCWAKCCSASPNRDLWCLVYHHPL